jgi:fructokinase
VVAATSRAVATIGPDGAATYEFELDWRLGEIDLPAAVRPVVVHAGSIGAVLAPGAERVLVEVRRARSTATVGYDLNVRPGITGTGSEVLARVDRLVGLADVVKASDEDLETLWPDRSVDESVRALLDRGPSLVAVTGGGDGTRWWTGSGSGSVPSVRVEVVDTIGAGDTFMAGLLDALWQADLVGARGREALADLDGPTADQVCAWAARAAAVTVSRPGADPPTRAELAL